jgi:hypothetical protein
MEILHSAKPAGAIRWERTVEDAVADFENIILPLRDRRTSSRSMRIRLEKNFGTEASITLQNFKSEDFKVNVLMTFEVEFNCPATIRDTEDFVTQIKTMQQALELGSLLKSTLSNRNL